MGAQKVRNKIDSKTLEFLQKNVLSITDLTRTNRLSEILTQFAKKETQEVFVIQNHKNKDATGILVDLDHYLKLLKLEEIIQEASEQYMVNVAKERKSDVADIPLSEVIENDTDIDMEYIFKNLDKIELDD